MNGHRAAIPEKNGKQTTPKDFILEPITLQKGLVGAKPEKVCRWILELLNFEPGDEVADLYPGIGIMGRVVSALNRAPSFHFDERSLFPAETAKLMCGVDLQTHPRVPESTRDVKSEAIEKASPQRRFVKVSLMRRWNSRERMQRAELRKAANQSDIHTLTVAIGRLRQGNSNPLLVAAMKDLLSRVVVALNESEATQSTPEGQIK